MDFILASGSPRRKELMEMLGVKNLKIIPAKGEEAAPAGEGPEELVMALAAAKAEEVAAQAADDDVVVAADTIVWLDGRPFGKPHSREEAMAMLRPARMPGLPGPRTFRRDRTGRKTRKPSKQGRRTAPSAAP